MKVEKFKILATAMSLFALIGSGVLLTITFETWLSFGVSLVVFSLLPAYGAYGVWKKQSLAMVVMIFYFANQSVRYVSPDNLIPHIAPITISFPLGEFSNGQGYLIDYFAIFMVLCFAWLLTTVIKQGDYVNE